MPRKNNLTGTNDPKTGTEPLLVVVCGFYPHSKKSCQNSNLSNFANHQAY
jgi:hypothetical protein